MSDTPAKDPRGEGERWLAQARHDLEVARLTGREGHCAYACFLSQQAAEKALKAILYTGGERIVIGHSVLELARRARARAPGLQTHDALAGTLDQYYVATRYPSGLPGGVPFEAFTGEQARAAVDGAARFVEIAAAFVTER